MVTRRVAIDVQYLVDCWDRLVLSLILFLKLIRFRLSFSHNFVTKPYTVWNLLKQLWNIGSAHIRRLACIVIRLWPLWTCYCNVFSENSSAVEHQYLNFQGVYQCQFFAVVVSKIFAAFFVGFCSWAMFTCDLNKDNDRHWILIKVSFFVEMTTEVCRNIAIGGIRQVIRSTRKASLRFGKWMALMSRLALFISHFYRLLNCLFVLFLRFFRKEIFITVSRRGFTFKFSRKYHAVD